MLNHAQSTEKTDAAEAVICRNPTTKELWWV